MSDGTANTADAEGNQRVSRRRFLKYAAATGGGALVGSALGYYLGQVSASATQQSASLSLIDALAKAYGLSTDEVSGALQEKSFTGYINYTLDQATAIKNAFQDVYPFLTENVVSLPSVQIGSRFSSEAAQGVRNASLLDLSDAGIMTNLVKSNLLLNYTPPNSQSVLSQVKSPPYWYGIGLEYNSIVWNTNLVSDAQAPKTWWDLADPVWNGKLGMSTLRGGSQLLPNMMWRYGLETQYGRRFWDALATNNVKIYVGGTTTIRALVAGEISVMVDSVDDSNIPLWQSGAPIKWVYPNPTPAFFLLEAITKNAPSPNAAKFFLNWILSQSGQLTVQRVLGVAPVRPDVPDIRPILTQPWFNPPKPPSGVWFPPSWDWYLQNLPALQDEYKAVFHIS